MKIDNSAHIFFLVNANHKIGGGHLVRCSLIANELIEHQVKSSFIFTNTDKNFKIKIQKNFDVFEINEIDSYNPDLLVKIISEKKGKDYMLVIDSDNPNYYKVNFQAEIRALGIRLMIITVNPNFEYHSDILMNQNILSLTQEYKTASFTKKLLGPKYFILDKNFRVKSIVTAQKKAPFNLFIAFGGADYYNLSETILESLSLLPQLFNTIILVIGGLNKNKESIKSKIATCNNLNVQLHINTNKMLDLMKESDIAITSSGLTFWELASLKKPAFMIAASEREKAITNYLHNEKYCFKLGEYDNLNTQNIANEIEQVMNMGVYQSIHINKLEEKINLNGVELVVKEMINIF